MLSTMRLFRMVFEEGEEQKEEAETILLGNSNVLLNLKVIVI